MRSEQNESAASGENEAAQGSLAAHMSSRTCTRTHAQTDGRTGNARKNKARCTQFTPFERHAQADRRTDRRRKRAAHNGSGRNFSIILRCSAQSVLFARSGAPGRSPPLRILLASPQGGWETEFRRRKKF